MQDRYKAYLDQLAEQKTLSDLAAPDDGMKDIAMDLGMMGAGSVDLRKGIKIAFPDMDELIIRNAAKRIPEYVETTNKFVDTLSPNWRKTRSMHPAADALDVAEGAAGRVERLRSKIKQEYEGDDLQMLREKYRNAVKERDAAIKEFREISSKPKSK